jgi:hypothetical protein
MRNLKENSFSRAGIFIIGASLVLLSLPLANCKSKTSTTGPDTPITPPTYVYRDEVQVTYQRDPAKITYPGASDYAFESYELYDPQAMDNVLAGESIDAQVWRIGYFQMERIGENLFRGKMKKVFVNSSPDPRHIIVVSDNRIEGLAKSGITIEGAYDILISDYFHFRMAKN